MSMDDMDGNAQEMDDEAGIEAQAEVEEAQKPDLFGRKPFGKEEEGKGASEELFDEEYVKRMQSNGAKPKNLFAKGQMALAKKMGKY